MQGTAGVLDAMGDEARGWLRSLAPTQRSKAAYPFPHDSERTRWYYVPTEQGGLALAEMDSHQQRLAHRLIASGLSSPGYATACVIMGLENVLDALEGWLHPYPGRPEPSRRRDPQMYFLSVFGDPDASAWGWRLGGHHLSLNYTIVGGELAVPTIS